MSTLTNNAELGGVGIADVALLTAREDLYGGMIIAPDALPHDHDEFVQRLKASLEVWRVEGRRGVWLQLPIHHAALVPLAVNNAGFKFHHAEQDYVMMTAWLPSTPNSLPANPSHQVGVGAFVLDGSGRMLVVQERSGPLKGKGVWKVPTGLVTAGEDIVDAVAREVKEETGVNVVFSAVLAIRQMHRAAFSKSDLFFLCAARAEPAEQPVVVQEEELVDAKWMDVEEYAAQEFLQKSRLQATLLTRCRAWAQGQYQGLGAMVIKSTYSNRTSTDLLMLGEGGEPIPAPPSSSL